MIESFGVIIYLPHDSHVTLISTYFKELTIGSEACGRVKAGTVTVTEMNSEMVFSIVFKFYNFWQVLEDVVLNTSNRNKITVLEG